MARKRNLAPSFFKNEDLASLEPLARILFQGLWCLADRNGNLEYRPMRIKAEVFPYEASVQDVESWLQQLASKLLVSFYEVADKRYIHVTNFLKYQSPHPQEKATYPQPIEEKEEEDSFESAACEQLTDSLPATCEQVSSKALILSPSILSPGFLSPGESANAPPPAPSAILPAKENQPETISTCWQSVFGEGEVLGNHRLEQLEHAGIENFTVFRRVLEIWKTNGHSIRNIAGMIERYGKELEKAGTRNPRDGEFSALPPLPPMPEGMTLGQQKRWQEEQNRQYLSALKAGNGAA